MRPRRALLSALVLTLFVPAGAADAFDVAAPAPPGFDREAAALTCLEHLVALIAIDTTNAQDHDPEDARPNGNELETARYFASVLSEVEGVETHVLEAGEGRANFIARLRAGAPSGARPVLVMGHMDVVGADRTAWASDPFEAALREDGYLYGRGAIDCKGPLAAELTAFVALAARRETLTRDIVLLATAAEEGGPPVGIDRVLEQHRELLGEPEFALNEGGRIRLSEHGVASVNIQTTEKVYYDVHVTATGPSGHGSVPLPDNALAALARAVSRVHAWRAPGHLNETTALYFRKLAESEEDPALAQAMQRLVDAVPGSPAFAEADAIVSMEPKYNAVIRAGQSLTILDGGFRSNVIPSSGRAVFNLRVLPDDSVATLLVDMAQAAGESSVTFTLDGETKAAPPPSPVDTALYRAMEQAAHEMAPDAAVIPFMSTGATDGAALRAAGIPTYGILPIPLRPEDELRMHGDEERAPVAGLGWAAEYVYRVLLAVASE